MKKYSKYTKEEIEKAVKENHTLSGVMRCFDLIPRGSNYKRFKDMIAHFKIDTSHFKRTGKIDNFNHHTLTSFKQEVLKINGKNWSSFNIKNKLFQYNLLENTCVKCSQKPSWNGKELKLQLDHINGNHRDNRINNLRILCPNCHTQTATFCNKN